VAVGTSVAGSKKPGYAPTPDPASRTAKPIASTRAMPYSRVMS
jgi:hypothetical protein